MKTNEGNLDRVIRVIVGLGILLAGYLTGSWWGLVGLIPLLTGALGFCPTYTIFGFSTCSMKKSEG